MDTEYPVCIPISYKIYASQSITSRLRRDVRKLEVEMAKEDPDEEWIDNRITAIAEARDTLEYINEMKTCGV